MQRIAFVVETPEQRIWEINLMKEKVANVWALSIRLQNTDMVFFPSIPPPFLSFCRRGIQWIWILKSAQSVTCLTVSGPSKSLQMLRIWGSSIWGLQVFLMEVS